MWNLYQADNLVRMIRFVDTLLSIQIKRSSFPSLDRTNSVCVLEPVFAALQSDVHLSTLPQSVTYDTTPVFWILHYSICVQSCPMSW